MTRDDAPKKTFGHGKAITIKSLVELPGFSDLCNGPDLRDMARVNLPGLIAEMTSADIVTVIYPDGAHTMLRGQEMLQHVLGTGETAPAKFLVMPVANVTQAEMVAAALQVIDEGNMTASAIETFRAMLASVQSDGDTRH